MNGFEQLLSGMPEFRQIKSAVESRDTPVLATRLSEVHKAHLIYSLTSLLGKRGLVVASDEANAMRICEDINIMAGEPVAAFYPSRDLTFH